MITSVYALPKCSRHGELLVLGVHDGDLGCFAVEIETELLHLATELLATRHRKVHLLARLLNLLGNLHDAVAPVVGALHVAHVVDVVVGDNERLFELVSIRLGAVAGKTVTGK